MKWIGLTGGIATGKSTVAAMMQKHGLKVIDADHIVHDLMKPGTFVYNQIVQAFGQDLVGPDQSLDRRRLASQVFSQPKELQKLEAIIHPEVRNEVARLRAELEAQGELVAVYDVPLLYEKNLQNEFDGVVCVVSSEALQKTRLRARNRLSENEIEARLRAQLPLAQKRQRATFVIENEGDLVELEKRVHDVVAQLRR